MSSALQRFEISVFANVGGGQEQLKAHFFTAVPAKRELLTHKQRHFVVLAMLMVQDKIEPCLRNSLSWLVDLLRHKFR